MNRTTNDRTATLPASPPNAIEQSDELVAESIRRIQAVLVKLESDGGESCPGRPHDRNTTRVTNWIREPKSAERYFGLLVELLKELRSAPLAALYPFRAGNGTEFRRRVGPNGRTDGLAIYVHTGVNDNAEMAELVGLLIRYRLDDAERQLTDTAMRSIRSAPQVPPQVGRPRIEVAAAVSPPVERKSRRTTQRPNEVPAS